MTATRLPRIAEIKIADFTQVMETNSFWTLFYLGENVFNFGHTQMIPLLILFVEG
jgi:hypothetical protein